MNPQKATHEGLKRHNRQLLLRAVYEGLAESRAALAQATGLTKPTVSSLIAELMAEGLIDETGQGPSSEGGGKRPRLIEFQARAREVIGVSVEHDRAYAVLADLAGEPSAHHVAPLDPERPHLAIEGAIDGLRAQLDAPLLCVGVGVPGEIDAARGVVRRSAALGWRDRPLAGPLSERYGVPVHLAHRTELSALAQYAFGAGRPAPRRLVTLLVGGGVEIGVTLEGGSLHFGGDLSALRGLEPPGAGDGRRSLGELLGASPAGWAPAAPGLGGGPHAVADAVGGPGAATGEPDYLALRYAAARGDAGAEARLAALAERLAPLVAWAAALLRPDHLSLAGPVVELGEPFLERLRRAAGAWLPADELDAVAFSLAYSSRLGAMGAVALALQRELAIL